MFTPLINEIRSIQKFTEDSVALHSPVFTGNERRYVLDTIDSTFVSSVGAYVTRFEELLCSATGAKRAVGCVNGTSALVTALILADVQKNDLVLTQSLTFVATANAIKHAHAHPAFLDVDHDTLGLSPLALKDFLENQCTQENGNCYHRHTGQRIAACLPMHTFGLPCRIDELIAICDDWNIPVVEDAAEALGSSYNQQACGTFGILGVLSFNGNKIVTTGGGGAILSRKNSLGDKAKHLTTTAKLPHRWEFRHDAVAWNFRMPNINAALGCAQMEQLERFITVKRNRAALYSELFRKTDWQFIQELPEAKSNYWLCAVMTKNRLERDTFLTESNDAGLMTRPVWEPLHTLPMYSYCLRGDMETTMGIAERLVNLPSGVGL